MLKNYFVIAIRNLFRNPVFSIINITGLVIGLACSILIGLWVWDELSWDNFHEKGDRIYRVYLNGKGDNGIISQMAICLPLAEEFKNNEPGIEYVAPTNWGWNVLLSSGDKKIEQYAYYAGEDFLKMFSFQMLKGSPDNQLKDPYSIVLTESAAREFFGNEDPMGKVLRLNNFIDLAITGILKDPPQNSTFKFKCLIPFSTYISMENWVKESLNNWGNNSFNMYVLFKEGADPKAVEARVKNVIHRHDNENNLEVTFLKMNRWRLYGEFENGKSVTGDIVYVRAFSAVAAFILFIACINFTNLATARSEHRAREVGLRKSIGASRKDLIFQFLGETILLAVIALLLAVALVEFVLPYYNILVNKHLDIRFNNPAIWIAALTITISTGIIAGSYPAFYLSAFRPMLVLKGKISEGRRGALPRKVLVTSQFFFSIFLIIATIIIYQQIRYLKDRPVGYTRDNLLMVAATGDITKNFKVIKNELLSQKLAVSVSSSSSPVTNIYSFQDDIIWPGKTENQRNLIATVGTGYDYSKTTGTKITEGRDFSEDFADSSSFILNQAAVDYMGLENPVGETIHWGEELATIVGIAGNVVMTSPFDKPVPTAFYFNENYASDVLIRLPDGSGPHELIAGIEKIFKKYNPEFPLSYRFADQEYSRKFTSIELIGKLSNIFASLAIFISCLGLFGLAAFTVERRTREIGIRKVLGATVTGIVTLLSGEFTILVLIAFIMASPVTVLLTVRILEKFSYHVSIHWWIFPLTGLAALALAILSVCTQAIRAAMSNPVNALRNE